MKILLISHSFSQVTHGPAKFAHLLLALNEMPGIEIRILTEQYVPHPKLYPISFRLPRPLHAFVKVFRGFKYYACAKRIRREYPYDFLMFNDGVTAFWSAFKYRNSNVSVVSFINDEKYIHIDGKLSWRKKVIYEFYNKVEYISALYSKLTITPSGYLCDLIKKKYRVKNVRKLYQAVDFNQFKIIKDNYNINLEKVKVLFVKSNYEIGGLEILIKALLLLENIHWELQIIGPSRSFCASFEALASNGNNISLSCLGPMRQEEVFEYMASSDILCIPSFSEGLGVANIEGVAIGIPVVSTATGGIPEVLGDGRYGWLAKPGDPIDLAKRIESCVFVSPEERKRKALIGRKHVETNFGHIQMLDNLIEFLKNVSKENNTN